MNNFSFCNSDYGVASGLGSGIALIVAGTSNTEFMAFLGQPIPMAGPCMLTMEYHEGFKRNPKYVEYQETIRNRKQRLLTIPKKEEAFWSSESVFVCPLNLVSSYSSVSCLRCIFTCKEALVSIKCQNQALRCSFLSFSSFQPSNGSAAICTQTASTPPTRVTSNERNPLPVHHCLEYVRRTIKIRTTHLLHYNTIGACHEVLFIGRSTTSGSLSDLDCLTDGSDGALPKDVCFCCPKRPSFGFVVNTRMTFKNPLRLNIVETTKLAVVGMVLVPWRNDIHRTTLSGTMQT